LKKQQTKSTTSKGLITEFTIVQLFKISSNVSNKSKFNSHTLTANKGIRKVLQPFCNERNVFATKLKIYFTHATLNRNHEILRWESQQEQRIPHIYLSHPKWKTDKSWNQTFGNRKAI
jgi:hypothetical protein